MASKGGTLDDEIVQTRLLKHANEVRKHANLDTLDAFLGQSGYSWIEMMVSHAKDSFESYSSATHDADNSVAHAFEHRMAAELLKTPSPKKDRFRVARLPKSVRPANLFASAALPTSDPFPEEDDEDEEKENKDVARAPIPASVSPKRASPAPLEDVKVVEEVKSSAAAPKRTLSSMAHAKKSILGSSSSAGHARASSATQSNNPAPKSSFLSKSIMRVEQDRKSFDDSSAFDVVEVSVGEKVASTPAVKRKSDDKYDEEVERETMPVAKAAKLDKVCDTDAERQDTVPELASPKAAAETLVKQSQPPQSLREKIESFNAHKTSAPTSTATATATASGAQGSRNFSSMSTHSVGLGAAKISSPIFSRSNSQNTLAPEASSPTRGDQDMKELTAKLQLVEESRTHDDEKATEEASPQPQQTNVASSSKQSKTNESSKELPKKSTVPVSTTPLHSPGPNAYSIYPSLASVRAPPTPSPQKANSPVRNFRDSVDRMSDSDLAAYDTSSDGDLSLVDLMGTVSGSAVKGNAAHSKPIGQAPRPPGTNVRPPTTKPDSILSAQQSRAQAFMPSSVAGPSSAYGKDNRSPSRLARIVDHHHQGKKASISSSSTSTTSSSTTSNNVNAPNGHATWSGSISSKLKGILGFSTSTSPQHSTTSSDVQRPSSALAHAKGPALTSKPVASLAPSRKNSFTPAGTGNAGARLANAEKRLPGGTLNRSEQVRKKEVDTQADRAAREREERTKAMAESSKKRLRDEATSQQAPSTVSKGGKTTTTVSSSVKRTNPTTQANSAVSKPLPAATAAAIETKKRKSNDGNSIAMQATTKPALASHPTKATAVQGTKPGSTTTTNNVKSSAQTLPKSFAPKADRAPTAAAAVFSDHNPFQRAQQQQQQQALAAVAQQMQRHKAANASVVNASATAATHLSPNAKAKMASTAHIELEEPDSAYSDSDDEETIRRRKQHKPWETREELAIALEAQASVDADLIFGIPQGGVPLDDILPAETDHARVRRMRPRSSSATWSRDGLKQFEIDRYNERMGIKGPGARLTEMATTRDDGAGTPSRPASRMSALAQSAIAQGQVSAKKGGGSGVQGYR